MISFQTVTLSVSISSFIQELLPLIDSEIKLLTTVSTLFWRSHVDYGVHVGGFGAENFIGVHHTFRHVGAYRTPSPQSPTLHFKSTYDLETTSNAIFKSHFLLLLSFISQRLKSITVRQVRTSLSLVLPSNYSKDILDAVDAFIETMHTPSPKKDPDQGESKRPKGVLLRGYFKRLFQPKLGRYFTMSGTAITVIAVAVEIIVKIALEEAVKAAVAAKRIRVIPRHIMLAASHHTLLQDLFHHVLIPFSGVLPGYPNVPQLSPNQAANDDDSED